ncbi:amidohydrolase family protein [Tuwongella immobilis]|uniref:Amidohydrolase 3 domain-containing protein n=1 Tax=Tuwongella immobilis TaxID=692036 RepID=A0A6C2YT78_9BACT|nr:amidohydrolase family protein [Tuwongella immobilis]VIP04239.1 gluconolactonase : Amidohydrolase 3 OS=Chthoniobacter flavus Ellin428 GN=CfE428DRAFT_1053 PE=4 SV=1: Amidohydro_3: SGL [Tuwongella immobilis]VTS05842.1 gluconolactonase : Amidohydrolase 3 OS=Chthoniobacter flavus Ellin428 GN=CfE428DRAFT_1053 PE=4 SV=1: Amidohydro_3: SGL [Tuwongella immobilis]
MRCIGLACVMVLLGIAPASGTGIRAESTTAAADWILHNGKVVTVDAAFSIHSAIAIAGEKIVAVGTDGAVMARRGPKTQVIDLHGKMVLPGLIDSHVHPLQAAMHEHDHPIPQMDTIADVLAYIRTRAEMLPEGAWISLSQVFITRLKEQRYPTRQELDTAAPHNPVIFSTGPDASVNSLALKLSGIDKDFQVRDGGPGYIEKDPQTGEPTGIIRSCTRYIKTQSTGNRKAERLDREFRLRQLFADYNAVGITGVIDRNASASAIEAYQSLLQQDALTVRVAVSHGVGTSGTIESIQKAVKAVADHPLRQGGPMLRIIGIKTFLDGGMLTGSAYMQKPWGVSEIYSIKDPEYRGLLFIPKERLLPIVQATVAAGLQFTAHSVGDGAVETLLNVYEEINRSMPVQATRPCLTHSNFMSEKAIRQCAKLGVVVDIQPVWLYLDSHTLRRQFGDDRLRYFQPLKSLFDAKVAVGGGSDHMQKIGSFRSVNPYNPFLGMQTALTRIGRFRDDPLHPEEALSREQVIRFYTANNSVLMFQESAIGTLEVGKFADLIVIDRDLLTCPVESIRDAQCLQTFLRGKRVFVSQEQPIFEPGAKLEVLAKDGAGGEGPAYDPEMGIFSSGNGHINRLTPDGKSQIFRKDAGTNGLLFDFQGNLLACEPVKRRVTRTDRAGNVTVLTDAYNGKKYNQPNDLTLDSKGRIYFSDPRYGTRDDMQQRDAQGRIIEGVYRIDPDGKVTRVIGREVERANGVLVSADDRYLFVADNNNDAIGGARKLYRFDLNADGSVDLASQRLLYDWGRGRGPDGLKQDIHGRLYVAGGLNRPNPPAEPATDVKGGVYVFSPDGKLLTFLPVPTDEVTNCAFTGKDRRTLVITGGGVLYQIRTTTPGRVTWPRD